MGVARRFTLEENAIKELDLEEVEVSVPDIIRYLIHQHLGHAAGHQSVMIVIILDLREIIDISATPKIQFIHNGLYINNISDKGGGGKEVGSIGIIFVISIFSTSYTMFQFDEFEL